MNQNSQGGSVLPEHIRASLAKYSEHEQLTCLECGYSGLMGVAHKTDRVPQKKFWLYMLTTLGIIAMIDISLTMQGAAILPWWLHLGAGLGVALFTAGSIKTYECPNCNAALNRK